MAPSPRVWSPQINDAIGVSLRTLKVVVAGETPASVRTSGTCRDSRHLFSDGALALRYYRLEVVQLANLMTWIMHT
jgi:hypothetical protein